MLTFTTTYGKIEKSIFMSDSFSPAAALVTSLPLFKETMMEIDELMKAIETAVIDFYDHLLDPATGTHEETKTRAEELALVAANARAALRAEFARLQQENEKLHGAMAATDYRLYTASKMVGLDDMSCDAAEWMAGSILWLRQELDDERAGRPLLAKVTDRINDLQQELDAMTKERDTQRELIGRPAEAIYGEYHDMREELAALKEPTGLCQWMYDDNGFWKTTCEEAFCIEDGTPKDNGMRFCVYCGKPLAEVIPPEDPENA